MSDPSSRLPLEGRTVLVTRSRDQALDLSELLRESGASVEHFAVIEIVPPASFESLDTVIDTLGSWDWLVFTSTNGVDAFGARMAERDKQMATPRREKIAAVGQATAARLRAHGILPDIVPSRFQATEILPHLPADQRGVRTAVIRALEGRDELIGTLRAKGGEVFLAVAYETRGVASLPDSLRVRLVAGAFDALTFTSPSTVENLFRHLSPPELEAVRTGTRCFSIGPVTSKAIAKFGMRVVIEAKDATMTGLRDAMIKFFYDIN